MQWGIVCRHFASTALEEQAVQSATVVRPKAANPPTFRPMSLPKASVSQRKPKRTTFRSRSMKESTPRDTFAETTRHQKDTIEKPIALATSCWVQISDVPPLATLDDVVNSVAHVLDIEREIGILDLDGVDGSLVDPSTPWVKSARIVLSTHGRPTSWRIQLENRSVVHSFLEHTKENKFTCVWKESRVAAWNKPANEEEQVKVSDSTIRVENCPESMTSDYLRHLFRRYDFSREGTSIANWSKKNSKNHNMYLVHFADPSWARAAVREMQGILVHGRQLKMAQYPQQIM